MSQRTVNPRRPSHAPPGPRLTALEPITSDAPLTGFAEFGVSKPVVDALKMRGISGAFAIQELVLRDAIAGRDVLARSRTGSGKTLAFAVPIVERLTPERRQPDGADPGADAGAREPGDRGVPRDRRRPQPARRGGLRRRRDRSAGQARPARGHRDRHARPAARPGGAQAAPPGPRADLRARRGRPHARHGVPARRETHPRDAPPRSPDDAVLRHARRRGRAARRTVHARPGEARGGRRRRRARRRRRPPLHRGGAEPQVAGARPRAGRRPRTDADLRADAARCRPAREEPEDAGLPRGRVARRHDAGCARTRAWATSRPVPTTCSSRPTSPRAASIWSTSRT